MRNDILMGDALRLIKEMPDRCVDLIITDPPYLIEGLSKRRAGIRRWNKSACRVIDDIIDSGIEKGFDAAILPELVRVMKRINIYIFCNKAQIPGYLKFFVEDRKCAFDILIWAKQNPSPFYGAHYLADKEYILFFKESGAPFHADTFDRGRSVFFTQVNKTDREIYGHPTIKPQSIIETLIMNSSDRGDLVFDPFVGSGTTCAAAKALGRDYIGFELSPKWHAVAVDRLKGITKAEKDRGSVQLKLFNE